MDYGLPPVAPFRPTSLISFILPSCTAMPTRDGARQIPHDPYAKPCRCLACRRRWWTFPKAGYRCIAYYQSRPAAYLARISTSSRSTSPIMHTIHHRIPYPPELVENIQWYVQNRWEEEEEDELNGADERQVNQLIAELNTNPPDGETITLEVTDLAEDHAYCIQNPISCTHCIPCIHTHQSISSYMCPSMWSHHQPGVARPRGDAGGTW